MLNNTVRVYLCAVVFLVTISIQPDSSFARRLSRPRGCRRCQGEDPQHGYIGNACFLWPVTGCRRAALPRWAYNAGLGRCQAFSWGGCGGNGNRFQTEADCMAACAPNQPESSTTPAPINENACGLPAETGLCLAFFPRFAYNSNLGRCQEFVWGGCGGNANNFKSEAECLAACAPIHRTPSPYHENDCSLDPVTGYCRAVIRRWAYHADLGRCQEFIYGGCGGNNNKFKTEADCMAACSSG